MAAVYPRLQTPEQLATLADRFRPHLGGRVELVCWDDPPRGPRAAPTVRAGRLLAVTDAGFVLERPGRGGCYRWFCGWVDLWTGHVVVRMPRELARAVQACWQGRRAADAPEGVAAGGGH